MKKLIYHLERRYCPRCKKVVSAKAPGVLAKCLYGNQLLAYVAVQHYIYGNFNIIDYLPLDVDINSVTGGGDYNAVTHTVTWPNVEIAPGDSNSFTISVKVNECAEPNSVITNYCRLESDLQEVG